MKSRWLLIALICLRLLLWPAVWDIRGAAALELGTTQPNGPWFNIQDFGAVDDAYTDCTAAIMDALDALPAAGGVLLIPPTENGFIVDSTITLPAGGPRKQIYIIGYGSKIIAGMLDGTNLFETQHNTHVTFIGIMLVGNENSGHAVYSDTANAAVLKFDNCKITGFTNTDKFGIYSTTDYKVTIDKTRIWGNDNGAYIADSMYGDSVTNNYFWGNIAYTLKVKDVVAHISGNYLDEANGGSIEPVVSLMDWKGSFIGNLVDGRGGNQHLLHIGKEDSTYGCVGWTVSGNKFEFPTDTTPSKYCIYITGAASDGHISGNHFLQRNRANSPVRIEDVDGNRVCKITLGQNSYSSAASTPMITYDDASQPRAISATFLNVVPYHFTIHNVSVARSRYARVSGSSDSPAEYSTPVNGWVVGLSARASGGIDKGTITIIPSTGDTLVLNKAHKSNQYFKPAFIDPIGRGSLLRVLVKGDQNLYPRDIDLSITVYIALDLRDYQ